MQVIIFCGGMGMRLGEKEVRPKPLVDIGGKPIIWHIMKIYAHYGFNDFILCLGYNGHLIRDYFLDLAYKEKTVTVNTKTGDVDFHDNSGDEFHVTMVDTGQKCMTGGRLNQIKDLIKGDKFFLTYGDGVSDINIEELLKYHNKSGKIATVTGVNPQSEYGFLDIQNGGLRGFSEKPKMDHRINGGFFVFDKKIFDHLVQDEMLEEGTVKKLIASDELGVYSHDSFWYSMDTFKDRDVLNKIWESDQVPWKFWN